MSKLTSERQAPPVAQAQHSVPEGWKLVPVEPTPEMAAVTVYNGITYTHGVDFEDFKADYAAMLAAAPSIDKEVGHE
ncbi:hypothetical protein [Pseudomonas phage K4]|nr:hypothetical protein [Pseudomonas phage IME180]QWS69977.1 hypothetical protein [Pseudomonas phage K4]